MRRLLWLFLVCSAAAQGLPTEYDGGNTNIVTAYNYGRDGFTPYVETVWSFDHHAYSSFDLWEANENGTMSEDNTRPMQRAIRAADKVSPSTAAS